MSALQPLIATALSAALLLTLVHAYLYRVQGTRALGLWTLAWGLYTLRFGVVLLFFQQSQSGPYLWLHQMATAASGMFLLWGALAHTRGIRSMGRPWIGVGIGLIGWITVSVAGGVPAPIVYAPVFVFIAVANFYIAWAYLSSIGFGRLSRRFVGVVFILWGIHKLDYPFLRDIPNAAVWGYGLGAFFTMAAGLGLLVAYLEQARAMSQRLTRRFESLVASLSDVVFTLDSEGRHTALYGRWVEDEDASEETYLGRSAIDIFGPEQGTKHVEMAKTCIRENRIVTYEWSLEGEHGVRFFLTSFSPIRREKGPPAELVGIAREITELKHTQLSLEKSLRDKETLLQEVHHRVKNNLQIIVSLLRLQSRDFGDQAVRKAFGDTMARVSSMAQVHERLYQSSELDAIRFDEYLKDVSRSVVDLYGSDTGQPEIVVQSDELHLDVARAIPLGLIATELVSNAAKHAFPDDEHGSVSVSFRSVDDRLVLRVADDGRGLPEGFDPKASSGLGMALVYALCDQLGGQCTFTSEDGTTVTVTAPRRGLSEAAGPRR